VNGKVVGQRYRIARLIGAGGMGSVYEAVDAVTGMGVAVKIITAEMAKNPTLMGRFEREARAAATIETPHIIKVLDAGTDEGLGLPFLAMELLDGEDVQQLIKRLGPLPPDLALRIVAQACLGLDRAHEARIIHRDIKPANFFLAKTGGGQRVVKLLDFGIAKIAHDPESNTETAGLTRTGSMLGSPLYMSPEQARGHKDLDRRADVWSMGVVLYQALTGRTPHQDTDALGELIIAICTEEAAAIQELAPWVSPQIAAIAHQAMRFAPEERFQTAADMLDAIRPLLAGGWAIEESMFQPLADHDRGRVQPRLITSPDMPVPRGARTGSGERRPSGSAYAASVGAPVDAAMGVAPTIAAASPAATPAPVELVPGASLQGLGTTVAGRGLAGARPPARSALIAVGAVAALALGGGGAYQLMRPRPEATLAQPSALISANAARPALEVKPRTVRVVVLPDEAAVEVDGVGVKPNDGAIEITGAIGSVHKVKVTSAEGEALRDVVVSEEGAIPPKVEAPGARSGAPKPSARVPAPRQPPPPPSSASPLRLER
jgi:eukaryotic-like serine/threonine-protein kinase